MAADNRLRRILEDPLLTASHPVLRPLMWTILFSVFAFIVWAMWAELDEVTRGEGRVVPFSRIQKIQSLEGGIIDRLLVAEGDLVKAGQPIIQLDPTRFRTSYQESVNQARALRASIARLDAEVLHKSSITFPEDIAADAALVSSEQELFKSRRAKLEDSTRSLNHQIGLAQRQLNLIEPLVAQRAVSQMEALKLTQEIAGIRGKLTEIQAAYAQDAHTERSAKKAELSALEPIIQQREDQLQRTEILSPVNGRVNTILINTRGGVIQPGEPIMEVIPIEERLLVEAKIKPQDVAFLVPGMPAKVKITAYDYSIYGHLNGTLEQISADTLSEDTLKGKEFYYSVLIKTDGSQLMRNGEALPIIPGMIAEVDILSGKRSVMNYLLRPLIKARLY